MHGSRIETIAVGHFDGGDYTISESGSSVERASSSRDSGYGRRVKSIAVRHLDGGDLAISEGGGSVEWAGGSVDRQPGGIRRSIDTLHSSRIEPIAVGHFDGSDFAVGECGSSVEWARRSIDRAGVVLSHARGNGSNNYESGPHFGGCGCCTFCVGDADGWLEFSTGSLGWGIIIFDVAVNHLYVTAMTMQ